MDANSIESGPGAEARRLDRYFESGSGLSAATRQEIWASAHEILDKGRPEASDDGSTGIAIGYVQSGKTTSFTALIAAAVDEGYQLIVALLGSTNLLLSQNKARVEEAFGLATRRDYRWIHLPNPSHETVSPVEISRYLARGRVVLVTLLKHHGRLDDLATVLPIDAQNVKTLVVDDEADQVSLNTRVRQGDESTTYAALRRLREKLGGHLYVQYTATPYAPLLLAAEDLLSPDFVVLLTPGDGYVGGYEFLVESRATVVRVVEDAPGPAESPLKLPQSLRFALADFLVGAAVLISLAIENAPVSMLVHPTGRRDPQRRYEFLIEHALRAWRRQLAEGAIDPEFSRCREEIVAAGLPDIPDADFAHALELVLDEATTWRINSDQDANAQVQWNLAPIHILIGGNKLSRGFTVEGLTVSWLGRSASPQLDTLVQRARAYGYRRPYLPYCRIYADRTTVDGLTAAVATDLDMRAQLRDWLERALPVSDWGYEVGLSMGPGLRPTRSQVLESLEDFRPGWHLLNKPDLDSVTEARNLVLVDGIGVRTAPVVDYGRLSHPAISAVRASELRELVREWSATFSPGWDREGAMAWLARLDLQGSTLPVVYLAGEDGRARVREWDDRLGFDQLMQGRDTVVRDGSYPGDRLLNGGSAQLQVHYVQPRGQDIAVHVIAINVAGDRIVRRSR